jgi:AraC-like DNA-binding protein
MYQRRVSPQRHRPANQQSNEIALVSLEPLAQDSLRRFVRECQVTAGACLPPADCIEVLHRTQSALSCFPAIGSSELLIPAAHATVGLATHVLDCFQSCSSHIYMNDLRKRSLVSEMIAAAFALHTSPSASLTNICATLHVSRCHSSKELRRATGVGFRMHVSTFRLLTSVSLLAASVAEVRVVAAASGFHHTGQLDREFKRWFHVTPRSFRRSILAK